MADALVLLLIISWGLVFWAYALFCEAVKR
jgi:uncharacterized protein (DUF486 family)